jgi:hypothetical protein
MKKNLFLYIIFLFIIIYSFQLKGFAQFEFPNKDGEWFVRILMPA